MNSVRHLSMQMEKIDRPVRSVNCFDNGSLHSFCGALDLNILQIRNYIYVHAYEGLNWNHSVH